LPPSAYCSKVLAIGFKFGQQPTPDILHRLLSVNPLSNTVRHRIQPLNTVQIRSMPPGRRQETFVSDMNVEQLQVFAKSFIQPGQPAHPFPKGIIWYFEILDPLAVCQLEIYTHLIKNQDH
jgi:hypothetical protein